MTIVIIILVITALVFAFLYFRLKSKVVEVSDSLPEGRRGNVVMKLQNELRPYTKIKDGKVFLKVLKY